MRPLACGICIALLVAGGASMAETLDARDIGIDGDTADWLSDENMFQAGEELDFDSWWGENNDINTIRCTWDLANLYLAVDGFCWGNNIMLFLDCEPGAGIPDQGEVTTGWTRKLLFFGREPDFFAGTWDSNTEPQLWRVRQGATREADQLSTSLFEASASFSQGKPDASMELALPWTLLFANPEGGGTLPPNRELAVAAVVVSGGDDRSGPDCAPNNSVGMPQNEGDYAFLDNFLLIRPDRDSDGLPDLGVAPGSREGDQISTVPPMSFLRELGPPQSLTIMRAETENRAFSPNGDGLLDEAIIRFSFSVPAPLTLTVHDATGRRIRTLASEEPVEGDTTLEFSWDGRNDAGQGVEAGLYLARLAAGRSERINLPLAVVR